MAERKGKIVAYFPANRQGQIQPEDKGPIALFYVTSVSNPEPSPKENDLVVFDAPEPRKNKKGKIVQDQASSVTIVERAPEPTPEELARKARQAARAADQGRGKGRGKGRERRHGRDRGDSKGRGTARDRRGEPSQDRSTASATDAAKKPRPTRGPRNKQTKNQATKNKRASIRAKVRYPLCAEVSKHILHLEQSNPALVLRKFVQWPAPADPKASSSSWKLNAKNQDFFLTRTVAPLYRNYEKRTLPWAAIRGRRELLLRSLEQLGYQLASQIVRGPWRLAISGEDSLLLEDGAVSMDETYGFPRIPAAHLLAILADALHTQPLGDEFDAATLRGIVDGSHPQIECLLLDAVPSGRIQQFTIEFSDVVPASSLRAAMDRASEKVEAEDKAHAMCMGDDAGLVLSLAVRGEGVTRQLAQVLLKILSQQLELLKVRLQREPNKTTQESAQAVLITANASG